MKAFFRKKPRFSVSKTAFPFLHALTGAFLLPLLGAVWLAAWDILRGFSSRPVALAPVLIGAAAYALFQAAFRKPLALYVFGHELTHAAAALLSGYRVKSFSASARGGEVVLSGTNVWVALAPYGVPLYTFLALAALEAARRFHLFPVPPFCFGFAAGFTFAFHAALTVYALRQNQPDLKYVGPFLSLVLILISNGVVLVLLLKALFPASVSLRSFAASSAAYTLLIWDQGLRFLSWGARRALAGIDALRSPA